MALCCSPFARMYALGKTMVGRECPPAEVRAKTRNLEDASNALEKSAPLSQGSTHII